MALATNSLMLKRPELLQQNFWSHVAKTPNECWLWTARKWGDYGVMRHPENNTTCGAHRFSWELHFGPIPDGMFVLHHCDNPPCVRPDHLFTGTQLDNMRDRQSKGKYGPPPFDPGWQAEKAHCKSGHPFDSLNTYRYPNGRGRICRACRRDRMRRYALQRQRNGGLNGMAT